MATCDIKSHQPMHSGLVSLHDCDHHAMELGLGYRYSTRSEQVGKVCNEVCEKLGLPTLDVIFAMTRRRFGEYYPATNGVRIMSGGFLIPVQRACINLKTSTYWITVAHELAHHAVHIMEPKGTPTHGAAFKKWHKVMNQAVSEALHIPQVREAVTKLNAAANAKKEAKPKAETRKRTRKPKTTKPCMCGCGQLVGGRFAQGHDATLKSILRRVQSGELNPMDVPSDARKRAIEDGAGVKPYSADDIIRIAGY